MKGKELKREKVSYGERDRKGEEAKRKKGKERQIKRDELICNEKERWKGEKRNEENLPPS